MENLGKDYPMKVFLAIWGPLRFFSALKGLNSD